MSENVMKMAKATEQDLKVSLDLAGVLEDISKGYYPRNLAKDDAEESDAPIFFDKDDPDHLRALLDRLKYCLDSAPGGIFRVAYGMATLLDPLNEIIDPNLNYLALHPRIETALAASVPANAR